MASQHSSLISKPAISDIYHHHHHMRTTTAGSIFLPLLVAQLLLLVTFAIILLGFYYFSCSIVAPRSLAYRTIKYPVIFSIVVSHGLFYILGEILQYIAASFQYPDHKISQYIAYSAIAGSLIVEPIVFAKVSSRTSSHVWNALSTALFNGFMSTNLVLHHATAWPRYFLFAIYSGSLCMIIMAVAIVHTISTHNLSLTERLPLADEKSESRTHRPMAWGALITLGLLWCVQSIPEYFATDIVLHQAIDLYSMLLVILAAMMVVMSEMTIAGWQVHPVLLTALNGLIREFILCYRDQLMLPHSFFQIIRSTALSGALGFIGSSMVIYYGKRSSLPHYIEPFSG